MTRRTVIVSGGFDPLHSGHIKLFNAARKLGDQLIVALNSDEWLERKKGAAFMPFDEREAIIKSMGIVERVIQFDDNDGSASDAIATSLVVYQDDDIIFANGGDRTKGNTPEMDSHMSNDRVAFAFGVGGEDKSNSSSWILAEWKSPKTERPWGYYRKLHQDGPGTHVKELAVLPGKTLSMQKHQYRSELWMVTSGIATVKLSTDDPDTATTNKYNVHETINIPVGTWHQLSNETDDVVKIVEIQYGERCMEEDIFRVDVEEGYGVSLHDK